MKNFFFTLGIVAAACGLSFGVFYVVNQKERIVSILTVDHRKDAYR